MSECVSVSELSLIFLFVFLSDVVDVQYTTGINEWPPQPFYSGDDADVYPAVGMIKI